MKEKKNKIEEHNWKRVIITYVLIISCVLNLQINYKVIMIPKSKFIWRYFFSSKLDFQNPFSGL